MIGLLKLGKVGTLKPLSGLTSPRSPRKSFLNYQKEAKDCEQGVKACGVLGVDPGLGIECPVRQQVSNELRNGFGDGLKEISDTYEEILNEEFSSFWAMRHGGPGHVRGLTLHI